MKFILTYSLLFVLFSLSLSFCYGQDNVLDLKKINTNNKLTVEKPIYLKLKIDSTESHYILFETFNESLVLSSPKKVDLDTYKIVSFDTVSFTSIEKMWINSKDISQKCYRNMYFLSIGTFVGSTLYAMFNISENSSNQKRILHAIPIVASVYFTFHFRDRKINTKKWQLNSTVSP